jgi:hypothetical protein
MAARRRVIIIGEDYERTLPLLEKLDAMGVRTEMWNVSKGSLVPTLVPEDAVYFCRQSPSASARGHAASIPYVRNLLWWLQFHGRTVINGLHAFELEMSKAAQMATLAAHGISTPQTTLVMSPTQLWAELYALGEFSGPVIIKPDTGGSGNDVQAFPSGTEAAAAVAALPAPVSTWIIQEHINAYSNNPAHMRSILRFEIVDGQVLYVMQIRAPVTEFKLCPCDIRLESVLSKLEFKIVSDPQTIPCFQRQANSYRDFCNVLARIWAEAGAAVGSVEAFLPVTSADDAHERRYSPQSTLHPEWPVVFEINFNSNYNKTAEELAGVCAVDRVADMLYRLAATPGQPPVSPVTI